MITITNVDDKFFTVDGIPKVKAYQMKPSAGVNKVSLVNVYDSKDVLFADQPVEEIEIEGETYETTLEALTAFQPLTGNFNTGGVTPQNTRRILYHTTHLSGMITGDTDEHILYEFLVPANSLPTGFALDFEFVIQRGNASHGVADFSVRYSTTQGMVGNILVYARADIGDVAGKLRRSVHRDSTASPELELRGDIAADSRITDDAVLSTDYQNETFFDTTIDNYIQFVVNNADALDTISGLRALCEFVPTVD